jgi:hypothetical protein
LTISQRSQRAPDVADTESLIRNETADEPSTSSFDPDDDKMIKNNEVVSFAGASKKNFFKSPLLYQNALLYVFSRLFMTTSLLYMPLWLNERSYVPPPPSNISNIGETVLNEGTGIENLGNFILKISLKLI